MLHFVIKRASNELKITESFLFFILFCYVRIINLEILVVSPLKWHQLKQDDPGKHRNSWTGARPETGLDPSRRQQVVGVTGKSHPCHNQIFTLKSHKQSQTELQGTKWTSQVFCKHLKQRINVIGRQSTSELKTRHTIQRIKLK